MLDIYFKGKDRTQSCHEVGAKCFFQKDIVSRIGIALPTYRRFETTVEISFRKLVEIAKFFDLADDIKISLRSVNTPLLRKY